MKDTYHVEAGTTATSECPIYRNGSWIGYVAPHHAKALADAFRQRDELLAALKRLQKLADDNPHCAIGLAFEHCEPNASDALKINSQAADLSDDVIRY
jgi:hypothetical protein